MAPAWKRAYDFATASADSFELPAWRVMVAEIVLKKQPSAQIERTVGTGKNRTGMRVAERNGKSSGSQCTSSDPCAYVAHLRPMPISRFYGLFFAGTSRNAPHHRDNAKNNESRYPLKTGQ